MQQSEQQTGEIVYKTPFTTLETFGTPLPVMVTETLTFRMYFFNITYYLHVVFFS